MGEKFQPAAESIQMKEEYLNWTQRAEEDVQSYVGEKTKLFRAAFPHTSQREWSGCWMEIAEGLCNPYVRDQMMASEPSDAGDFVRSAVRAVQAERARICIGDSTEGRDGLEPVSRQIAAGEGEMAKQWRQGRIPAGEERGKPRRGRPARRSPPAEGEAGVRGPCGVPRSGGAKGQTDRQMRRAVPCRSDGLQAVKSDGPAGGIRLRL